MNNQQIRIRLQSYDSTLVDHASLEIYNTAVRTGAEISGPIPMPTQTQIYTVKRSPHIDKESQEQFKLTTHTRVLYIVPSPQTVESLMKLELPAGVEVKIKLMEAA
ncbi:30S ribosomal protein S10 [Rickettsiales endosymbiont of Stachyamoeba lipophora]|uniref:30S ribosomal protein S10 n=1 Tax=Rickettsiales endosymbiont of Stachyamoeba lipophora TaxID=2486578 RepID=UPI000F64CFDA|nr:30S ribosomal protein S10 [Rickettsiales endosymbiont of Stachyamoeba lipophora]AZL15863.1 30S ribosomal protein S10 [Rickettsiales endosymbiont of Stachyamoeba lipophora]